MADRPAYRSVVPCKGAGRRQIKEALYQIVIGDTLGGEAAITMGQADLRLEPQHPGTERAGKTDGLVVFLHCREVVLAKSQETDSHFITCGSQHRLNLSQFLAGQLDLLQASPSQTVLPIQPCAIPLWDRFASPGQFPLNCLWESNALKLSPAQADLSKPATCGNRMHRNSDRAFGR